MRRLFCATVVTLLMSWTVAAQLNILAIRDQSQRSAANLTETTLTAANVNVTEFGKLYSLSVDGEVHAEPMYMTGVRVGGTSHNVLYLATVNGKLYAFDADGLAMTPLWMKNFGGPRPVIAAPITDGPVIDPATDTIYVVVRTNGAAQHVQWLHALDIASGHSRSGSPVRITGSVDGLAGQATGGTNLLLDGGHGREHGRQVTGDPVWDSPTDGPLVYLWAENDLLKAHRLHAGRPMTPALMHGEVLSSQEPGMSLTLSANGSTHGTGVVWASMPHQDDMGRKVGILRAYDAETLREIWTSEQNPSRDRTGRLPTFVRPLVVNGRVYIPNIDGSIGVYGLVPAGAAGVTAARTAIAPEAHRLSTAAVEAAGAGAIGINFVGTTSTLMAATESAGVIAKPHWNNAAGAVSSTALPLVDESGALTSAAVTWRSNNGWMTPIADQPGNARLMKGYLDTTSTSTTTITVTGLAEQSYDVYVYGDGDNRGDTRSAAYTVSGTGITTTTLNLIDPANTNFGAAFIPAANSNGNYVKFSLSATGFTLTVSPTTAATSTRRAAVNGLQIVPAPAIGIDFVGTSTAGLDASERAGVVPQTHWNNAPGAMRGTPLSLVDDAGRPTTATVVWTSNNGWMTPIADIPGNMRLMKGYLDTSSISATTVTVAGLSSGTYDVYVYADGDNRQDTRAAAYRISGANIVASTMNLNDQANTNFSGTLAQSSGTSGNYVKFTISGNGFTLTATPGASTSATRRAPVNAIQIVSGSLTPPVSLDPPITVTGVGAGQGVEVRDGKVYLYGDANTGVVREYDVVGNNALAFTGRQILLTASGRDVASHPTGLTVMPGVGTLLGDTVSGQGTIFMIDWARALANGTLDGAVQATVADDLAVNGTRPEFVRVGQRWLVATADYGSVANEIRLYDPERLKTAARTSEPGVLVYRFRSSAFVQTLHWLDAPGLLVLVQNQQDGQGWRLTVIDLARSITAGQQVATQTIDLEPRDELEGFHLLDPGRGLFLTSSAVFNVYFANTRLY
jgi:hypothetical protein